MQEHINSLEYEKLLVNYLITKPDIRDKILPHLTPEVFYDYSNKDIVKSIQKFISEYKKFPTDADMKKVLIEKPVLDQYNEITAIDTSLYTESFLIGQIEKFFRTRLNWNVISKMAEDLKENKDLNVGDLQKSNSFFFDSSIGTDLLEEAEQSYETISVREDYVPTSIVKFNDFTGGGFPKAGMTMFIGATGKGKSLIMGSLAVDLCLMGEKVLYITLENSEKMTKRRMLANLLNIDNYELARMSKEQFIKIFSEAKAKINNSMLIQYYPPKSLRTNHIRHLLKELKNKKNFVPSVLFVDYLGLMNSNDNIKDGALHTVLEVASQELTGIAGEYNLAVVTAMQFNRQGMNGGGLDKISASQATSFIAETIMEIVQDDDMKKNLKIKLKNIKGRNIASGVEHTFDIDYSTMKIYDKDNELNGGFDPRNISRKPKQSLDF